MEEPHIAAPTPSNPAATVGASPPGRETAHESDAEDDLDLWDAFSLLGDVGGRNR